MGTTSIRGTQLSLNSDAIASRVLFDHILILSRQRKSKIKRKQLQILNRSQDVDCAESTVVTKTISWKSTRPLGRSPNNPRALTEKIFRCVGIRVSAFGIAQGRLKK